MPKIGKRKNKKNKRKNRLRNAYALANNRSFDTIQRPLFGFIEPRCFSSLKYADVVNFTAVGASAGSSFVYNANSLFDPQNSVGGHQPYGFDTVASIYSHYKVYRLRWNIEYTPSSDRMMVGVIISSQQITPVTSLATYQLAAESPLSKSKSLGFSGGPPARFLGNFPMNAVFGASKVQFDADDTYAALVTSNPAQLAYLILYCYNPTAGNVTISANVQLYYESVLYDPYLQNQS